MSAGGVTGAKPPQKVLLNLGSLPPKQKVHEMKEKAANVSWGELAGWRIQHTQRSALKSLPHLFLPSRYVLPYRTTSLPLSLCLSAPP
jgi:hypothetical protein